MIDTIVFRIYNKQKYIVLLDYVRKFKSWSKALYKTEEEEAHGRHHSIFSEVVQYHGEVLDINTRRKMAFKSWEPFVIFREGMDYYEISLSGPKFLFNNNVCQMIPDPAKSDIDSKCFSSFFGFKKYFLVMIKELFQKIMKRFFGGIGFDWRDIYVARIDFCFNQFYMDKEEALYMLEQMKLTRKAFVRNAPDKYARGIHFVNSYYSFKIYHKGTEVKKHDWKFWKNFPDQLIVKKLVKLAERTLRYELTGHAKFISRFAALEIIRKGDFGFKNEKQEKKYKAKRFLFHLGKPEPIGNPWEIYEVALSDDICNKCWRFFYKQIEQFIPNKIEPGDLKGNVLIAWRIMQHMEMDLKQASGFLGWSDRTYYRVKKEIRRISLSNNLLVSGFFPPLDYQNLFLNWKIFQIKL